MQFVNSKIKPNLRHAELLSRTKVMIDLEPDSTVHHYDQIESRSHIGAGALNQPRLDRMTDRYQYEGGSY